MPLKNQAQCLQIGKQIGKVFILHNKEDLQLAQWLIARL